METIDFRTDDGAVEIEAEEQERIAVAFEFCEAFDVARLNHSEDIKWDKETGDEYLVVRLEEEDSDKHQVAVLEWHDTDEAESMQALRTMVLENFENGMLVQRSRYWLMSDGETSRFIEDIDPEPMPLNLEEAVLIREKFTGERALDPAA